MQALRLSWRVQTIAVDVVLSARDELMGEFKRGEHSNWDLDEEIQTWDKRAAVLAGGEASEDEDEEEAAPAMGARSPRKWEWILSRLSPMWGLRQLCPSLRRRL